MEQPAALVQSKNRVRDLTVNLLSLHGALLEPIAEDAMYAILSRELQRALGWRGEEHVLRFSAPDEEDEGNAQLVLMGSPAFDKMLQLAAGNGAKVCVACEGETLAGARRYLTSVEDKLTLQNARIINVVDETPVEAGYSLCTFKITVASDDVSEYIKQTMIANRSLAVIPELLPRLSAFALRVQPYHDRFFPTHSEEAVVKRAAAAVTDDLQGDIKDLKRSSLIRLQRDAGRLNEFFGKLYAETLRSKRWGGQGSHETIKTKIEAIQQELKQKTVELLERYKLHLDVRLDSMVVYVLPVILGRLNIQRKKQFRIIEVIYNPLLKRLEPLLCESCRRQATSPSCCDDKVHLLCENCDAQCSQCGRKLCLACFPDQCPKCGAKVTIKTAPSPIVRL